MTGENEKPVNTKDDPNDSAETLRIMVDLERYADMHAPRLADSAAVMDEARHRLAVLQQCANAYPDLKARLVALETENRRLQVRLDDALLALREVAIYDQDTRPLGDDPGTFDWWRRSMKQENIARRALQGDQNVTGT